MSWNNILQIQKFIKIRCTIFLVKKLTKNKQKLSLKSFLPI